MATILDRYIGSNGEVIIPISDINFISDAGTIYVYLTNKYTNEYGDILLSVNPSLGKFSSYVSKNSYTYYIPQVHEEGSIVEGSSIGLLLALTYSSS